MAMRRTYSEAYDRQLELTRLLSDEGVRLLAGTDGGWLSAPGLTLQQEFIELGRAGLSPLKILQMTTINAAEYLQRTGTMGTIEPGRDADLVLLEANPLDSVAHFSRIAGVVRAGRYLPRTQLDGLRESVAAGRGFLR
jgi:imidazolonepropionase-like amidohydrolase